MTSVCLSVCVYVCMHGWMGVQMCASPMPELLDEFCSRSVFKNPFIIGRSPTNVKIPIIHILGIIHRPVFY
jgi:hypothetical protein